MIIPFPANGNLASARHPNNPARFDQIEPRPLVKNGKKTLKIFIIFIEKRIFSIKKLNIFIKNFNISIEKTNISIEKLIIFIEKANIFIKKLNISIEKTNISIEKTNFFIEKDENYRISDNFCNWQNANRSI